MLNTAATQLLPQFIWRTRYRDTDASPPERSIGDTWKRVAASAAAVEREPELWQGRFLKLLQSWRFLPAGRILAGAGTAHQVTLCNCFVMGMIEDSVEGIFHALKEGALTMQHGGGVGYDFSTLRPRGARARSTGAIASGPVSFMRVWDAMCATILSMGARRGAMMATLRCDHPDIEELIDVKRSPEALQHFNLSVLLTDAFMEAVARDAEWPLVFPGGAREGGGGGMMIERAWSGSRIPVPCRVHKTVRARQLWQRLCDSAYDCAEPGVLFIDRINAENNLGYCETLSATNPCAEEPLPPYGACNLGSLNLTAFVLDAFSQRARLDLDAMRAAARMAVRFLDNVIEISRFPLPQQRDQAHRCRRVGLGITGLADSLVMLGLRYDTEAARTVAADLMRTVRDAAYEASVELARERGAFPAFDTERYLGSPFIERLPAVIRHGIRHHGTRNSHLLAIAPAGTISLLAGNLSSGIEPIFARESLRTVTDSDGRPQDFEVADFAYLRWLALHRSGEPGSLLDRTCVQPRDQVLMLAALQPYVDGSISKTLTLPPAQARQSVQELFGAAYDLHLKGCTVFREAARPGVIQEAPPAATAGTSGDNPVQCCDLSRETD